MADETTTTATEIDPARWRRDVLIGAGILLVVLNGAFVILGREYYRSKLAEDLLIGGDDDLVDEAAMKAMWHTLLYAYSVFSFAGVAALAGAMLKPREVAHGLAVAFGAVFLGSGVLILMRGQMPALVGVFQGSIGALMLRLAWSSYKQKDRAAWAFLLSLSAVLAGATFFGAPRIKGAMDAPSLWFVLLIPFLLVAQAVALYRSRNEYA
jgi:hypothetical protein